MEYVTKIEWGEREEGEEGAWVPARRDIAKGRLASSRRLDFGLRKLPNLCSSSHSDCPRRRHQLESTHATIGSAHRQNCLY